jgi:hypothetical protein
MRAIVGVAIGAGLVFASGLVGIWMMERQHPGQVFVLKYTKAGGMRPDQRRRPEDDPAPFDTPATRYMTWISSKCRIERWRMTNNEGDSDVPEEASLFVNQDGLTDSQFDCLADFVKPQFVTLTRMTQ